MGLFSSKKKHTVETTTVRVVEDENIPDTAKQAMLKAIMSGSDITEELSNSLTNSSVFDFDRMYRYGRDHYSRGLPNHQMTNSRQANVQPHVQSVINAMVGQPVSIDYAQMAPMDYTHASFQTLVDQYDYNAVTNEIEALSQQKGTTVWLMDIVPVYDTDTLDQADAASLTPIGFPATSGYTPERKAQAGALGRFRRQTNPLFTGELDFEVTYVSYMWKDSNGKIQKDTMTFLMEFDDIDADFFMARFQYSDDSGNDYIRYFSYEKGEGSFPVLDNLFLADYVNAGTYFPFVFFRTKDRNATADIYHDTPEYITSTKMLEKIGVDYQEMGDSVHDSPDIKDVDQAVMMMGVPMHSQDETEMAYLFEFWRNASILDESTRKLTDPITAPKGIFSAYQTSVLSQPTISMLRIYDADYSMEYRWRTLSFRTRAGRIGAVGTVTNTERTLSVTEEYTYQLRTRQGEDREYEQRTRTFNVAGAVLRKQITDATYEEVLVSDPKLYYKIYKGKGVTAKYGEDRFLVPIDHELSKKLPTMDRERLYLRSLHFVFNSHIVTKTKWYQSGAFKIVMVIVAVVITVMSGGSGSPIAAALVAAGVVVTTTMLVLIAIVEIFVMQAAFNFAAKELGGDFATVLAIALIIYGGYKSFQAGSVAGAPWAQEMFTAANGLMSGVQNAIMDDINDIVGELADLTEEYEGKMDELAEINKELSNGNLLDPLTFIGQTPTTVLGESPSDFYDRTVHSGNIGTLVYDMLHSHYDIGVSLPTISDTLREFV